MVRFALTPDGDLHLEDLRRALFSYLYAVKNNLNFFIRFENTKEPQEKKEQEIAELLALFGIDSSQLLYQRQNFRFHSAMALDLLHRKKAFSCFCSDEWIEKKKQEAKEAGVTYLYDDACRNLPPELVIDNTAPFCIRIVKPQESVVFTDVLKGICTTPAQEIDSFVILYQDKTPTALFATAVDDMLSDVSMVIRTQEFLENAAKEVHIRNSLGYEKAIEYAHYPPLEGAEDESLKTLLQEGFLPEAILNYLISESCTTPKEIFTLAEAKEWFVLENLSDSPASFDKERLKKINKEHLKMMDATELSRYVGFADAEIGELARLFLNEVATTQELKEKIASVFAKREVPKSYEAVVSQLRESIIEMPFFATYELFEACLLNEKGFNAKDLKDALRILLLNSQEAPDIGAAYECLKNYLGEIVRK